MPATCSRMRYRPALCAGRWAVSGALALFVLISCMLDGDNTAKRGSEVENEIHGVLVAVDGDPVQGARVKAVPVAGTIAKRGGAAADSDSVVTDKDGRYSLRGLEPGTYNLFGDYQSGDLVVLIPGVDHSDTAEPKDQGIDTLRAPGRIRGRLLLGDQGKGGVLAYVPGTSYLAVSDDSGWFLISGIPQGIHRVSYSAAGYVIPPDTGVAVRSGRTTDLPAKQLAHDPALNPPAPVGLSARYDTLAERTLLSWHPVQVSDLAGYLVYREETLPSGQVRIAEIPSADTALADTLRDALGETEERRIVYRVKAKDQGTNLSLSFSPADTVTAVSRTRVVTRIRLGAATLRNGTVSVGDSLVLAAEFANPTRRNVEVAWYLDGDDAPLRRSAPDARSGVDTLRWRAGAAGPRTLTARVLDESGRAWSESVAFVVLQDPPSADAGPDRSVTPGDSVALHGAASDGFGVIRKWEWDIGDLGRFRETPGPDTVFRVRESASGTIPCVLRVTDDDGNTATDTVRITVLPDLPVALADTLIPVSIGDRVDLRGRGRDSLGRIVRYEWDVGAQGFFQEAPDGALSFRAPDTAGSLACLLRVTDDDGNSALDTAIVRVLLDPPKADAGPDLAVSIGDIVRFRSTARDGFGTIVRWEWRRDGDSGFTTGSAILEDTVPHTPHPGLAWILRVTDDDGLAATDTVKVKVELDPPVAAVVKDPGPVFTDNAIVFYGGKSYDRFGSILEWEWDCDGAGFMPAASGISSSHCLAPSASTPDFRVRLRVTDDDGVQDTAELALPIHPGPNWEKVSDGFPKLDRSLAVVFQDGLWAVGNGPGSALYTWTSTDGIGWARTQSDALPWSADRTAELQALVVHKGRLFLFARYPNDKAGYIYSTRDGLHWDWVAGAGSQYDKSNYTVVSFKDRLWLLGGESPFGASGDVSYSEDGVEWRPVIDTWPLGRRTILRAAVLGDRLWIYGGTPTRSIPGFDPRNDLWYSEDGLNYVKAADSVAVQGLYGPSFLAFKGALWLIGGTDKNSAFYNDIYRSEDGVHWTRIPSTPSFKPLRGATVLEYGSRMWMLGGWNPESFTLGEVWRSP